MQRLKCLLVAETYLAFMASAMQCHSIPCICLAESCSNIYMTLAVTVLAERGVLSVEAEGQSSCFLFSTIHLESPIAPKSPLRTFFESQRRVQAQQVWLIMP